MKSTDFQCRNNFSVKTRFFFFLGLASSLISDQSLNTLDLVEVNFTSDLVEGIDTTTINFQDISTGGPISWSWDFQNDGIIDSDIQNPSWTFTTPGAYTVSLTASDSTQSLTETKIDYINILPLIPDGNFRAIINQYIEQPESYSPSIVDLAQVTGDIIARHQTIESIEGAQYLSNVEGLHLENNEISDLSPLSGLENLSRLYLTENQIINIEALSTLTNLSELGIGHNNIESLNPISELTNLIGLWVSNNPISDISPISNMTSLNHLIAQHNIISNIEVLSSLERLEELYINGNLINNLSPLAELQYLRQIVLDGNRIDDISPLLNLNLTQLNLYGNRISDVSILVELGNSTFNWLTLDHNPLSKEAFDVHIPILEGRNLIQPEFPDNPNYEAPCYPNPERSQTDVSLTTLLQWRGNYLSQNVLYDVWLGNSADSLELLGGSSVVDDSLHSFEVTLSEETDYWWRVRATSETDTIWSGLWQFSTRLTVSTDQDPTKLPQYMTMQQNYPNPFNPSTTIRYGLPVDSSVSLVIYDIRGNVVRTLEPASQNAGWHEVYWNGISDEGRAINTGLYFARIVAQDYSHMIKMLHLK